MLVVCVDDGPCRWCGQCWIGVKKNQIYTVIAVGSHDGVRLAEVWQPATQHANGDPIPEDGMWYGKRFRPCKPTDITLLEDLLKCPASPPISLPSPPQKEPITVPNVEVGQVRMKKSVGVVKS